MSKKLFTEKEIQILSKNTYVKSVSSKGITYTDEFKELFIAQNEQGKTPREIFDECGFDEEVIGIGRIRSSGKRWREAYRKNGLLGLRDTRPVNTGRPSERELSLEEKYARLEAETNLLKAENELLKKIRFAERGMKKIKLSADQKFNLIHSVIEKYNLKGMVSYLCKVAGVSRQGYYNYFSAKQVERRKDREKQDESLRDLILKAYNFKNRKKGARQIKMVLAGQFGVVFNLKRIRRIMKKYGIESPFRRANPYKRIMKATQEHKVVPNVLSREFKQGIPFKVLLTDITYLYFGKGKRAYLSTIIDASTNEVLAHQVSDRVTLDIATDTLKKLKKNRRIKLAKGAYIHSDQGGHYTSPVYQKLVKKFRLGQSMSRRGNCWDNAPQESFFGHFKDLADIKPCETLEELKQEVKAAIHYYNHYRYQWNMNKMTPVQYRDHLLKVEA
ncbi:IS3 family transposase [Mesobacillus sp. AQ2]|uniref:IS3 family transposase n=1 Tax=Mesobacillus sp. AQ2 TaxID=3043332 RepID=UPI0024C13C84|nr:IS3 family transposase [Mesobacillus sp. AQ2]WHX39597.1 IS3 family transposase [Mesobacillus sp. AQ2]